MTRRLSGIIVAAVILLTTSSAVATVDVNVYDETVYLYLDKLTASGLIRTYSPNQRPLSRFAVATVIQEAATRCEDQCAEGDQRLLTELGRQFSKDVELVRGSRRRGIDLVPIDHATISWTATNQPESTMPANGLGVTSGTVQPLLSYNHGQHYLKYANFYLDTAHSLSATPYFSVYVQPQFYSVSGGGRAAWVNLWRGYLKTGVKNFEFQIGRDDVKWGPGEESMLFGSNFKGFDMIRLTTPRPFHLPWVFRHVGQFRFTTFFALLGKGATPTNAIMSAYRLDWHPTRWLNLGLDNAVIMGGQGAKDPSILDAIDEYVTFFSSSGTGRASSNHIMGADFTARIPPLLGLELYGKLLLEDTQKELYYMLINDASWLAGIYLPKLDVSQKWSLRTEFVYTGQYAYRHYFYASGWALDGKFLGYDAGSDTYSVTAHLRHQFNFTDFVTGSFRYLYRSSNIYNVTMDSTGNATGLSVATSGPKEQHYLFKISGAKRLTKWLNAYADIGLDRVLNEGFMEGNSKTEFSTQLKFTFHDLVKE